VRSIAWSALGLWYEARSSQWKAVAGGVHVLLQVRMVLFDLLPVLSGSDASVSPQWKITGHFGFRPRHRDAAAVVRDRRRDAVDARRRQPRNRAPKPVADDADLEAGIFVLPSPRRARPHASSIDACAHGASALDVRLLIAALEPASTRSNRAGAIDR